jgi:hypothetical protein
MDVDVGANGTVAGQRTFLRRFAGRLGEDSSISTGEVAVVAVAALRGSRRALEALFADGGMVRRVRACRLDSVGRQTDV